MANAALMMGLNPPVTIDDVLEGRLSVDEVVIDAGGVMILPGGRNAAARQEFGAEAGCVSEWACAPSPA